MTIQNWTFDPAHSEISFKVRHMMFSKVTGYFTEWEGEFAFDPENPANAKTTVTIAVDSIDTKNADRDAHLKSGDFFDAEAFPQMRFDSTSFEQVDGADLKVHGNLTIRDKTVPVTLDVEYHGKGIDPWGNQRVGFSGKVDLDREAFGLTWNQALEAGGVLVGKKVEVELQVQATLAG